MNIEPWDSIGKKHVISLLHIIIFQSAIQFRAEQISQGPVMKKKTHTSKRGQHRDDADNNVFIKFCKSTSLVNM